MVVGPCPDGFGCVAVDIHFEASASPDPKRLCDRQREGNVGSDDGTDLSQNRLS